MDIKATAEGIKSNLEQALNKVSNLEKQNDNLDASIKELDSRMKEMESKETPTAKTAGEMFLANFFAQKDAIAEMVKEKKEHFSIEVKSVNPISTASITSQSLSLQVDPAIHEAKLADNAFLLAFGMRARTANKLSWVEATSQNGADYVDELGTNNKLSDVVFVEKQRGYGKVATKMTISTEVEDWFEQIYNYAVGAGTRFVNQKIDAEIFDGDGNDSSKPNHIYGVKGIATAFSALAPSVENANIADVIMDAVDQIAKAGYNANLAFVSWQAYRLLKEVKTTTGEYLFDRVNNMLNGVRVLPTSKVGATEMLIADGSVVEVFGGNGYELEFIRNGAIDGYDVYFRKAVQVKVATPDAKGLIYVADYKTAIASLAPSA